MAQALLHGLQHGARLASLDVDDAVRVQTGSGQTRGEQIRSFRDPEDRASVAGQNAGNKQDRCCTVLRVRTGAGNLMQRAECDAAVRQGDIDRRAERGGDAMGRGAASFQTGNADPQVFDQGERLVHAFPSRSPGEQEHIENLGVESSRKKSPFRPWAFDSGKRHGSLHPPVPEVTTLYPYATRGPCRKPRRRH